ncbi:MAG: hypothetical protein ABMA64_31490 [Myxococcota bacterium]
MTVALGALSFAALDTAFAEDAPQIDAGVRLGVGVGVWPDQDVMPQASLFADLRMRQGRGFLTVAPGLMLSGPAGDLDYGGLALELGGGWRLSDRPVAPYVGGGVSGRLLLSDESVIGFAPYGLFGLEGKLGAATAFGELRVYQNVLPVAARQRDTYPVEPGLAFGVRF